ncbi:MAG: ATP-grasp domain-containing protein [Prevotella sp.]|nr:ATP-grasp domain-containing protein [Candidatus Prevotella equi]
MKQKKILLLGGTAIQIPAIKKAKEMGLYVITCDNRPDNPGHQLADEYHNVSIMDNEAVLKLAKELEVDAVVNYILEAGIQTTAYAQESLGKPTSPYLSVHTLSNKKLFREFLKNNGFKVPRVYSKDDEIEYPVVVKPTDLWGSRGFTKVERKEDLQKAIDYAMESSLHGEIIIEQFIESWHADIEGDGFVVDGKITTHVWSDCYPDPAMPNPITPVIYCYPSAKPAALLKKLDAELQRLLSLLNMRTHAFNVEARIDKEGNVYLMEVAPRNGGNAITDVTSMATGKDIMEATIRAAIGDRCEDITNEPCQGFWCSYVVHTDKEGNFGGLTIDDDFKKKNLVSYVPFVEVGEPVHPYSGTNCSIGLLIARFDTREALDDFRNNILRLVQVVVKP